MAIRAEDLMLGDLVYGLYPNGKRYPSPCCISAVDIYPTNKSPRIVTIGGYGFQQEHLEPIPLTAEILEKNFPKKENEADYVKERMEVGFSVNWFPLSDLNGVFFIILDMPYKLETARIEHLHKGTFRYVHELQHLLRLCGIEKEIVL